MSTASPVRVATAPVVLTAYRALRDEHPSTPLDRLRPLEVSNRSENTPAPIRKDNAAHGPLAAQIRDLNAALAHLRPAERRGERARMLRAALYDLTRAARAEQLLQARIAHHAERQAVNNMPGAVRETGGGVSLGAGIGLPAAVEVSAGVDANRAVSTATFDDLAIARFDTVTVGADASAEAGLPVGLGAHAGLGAQISWGHGRIDDKMPDHVLALARASVARRLGGPMLLRALKRVFNPGRDRYAERISRAQAWESKLGFLLGPQADAAPPAFYPAPPAAIEATLQMVSKRLGLGLTVGPAGVNLSGSREKIDVNIDLPIRLTDAGADALRAMPQIRQELDTRLQSVLRGSPLRSDARCTLEKVSSLWRDPARHCRLDDRREAVASLATEFDHLQALVRLRLHAPGLAQKPLASLLREWCGTSVSVEAAMIHMLDTLAWLQATPLPPNNASHRSAWTALQNDVAALATRIHDSAFPHDRREVHLGTHAFAEMLQHIRTWRATLEGTAQWSPLGAAARASVAWQQRADSDPLRDGDYVDVTFATDLTPGLGKLLVEAQQKLGESWGELPVAQVEQVLTTLAPSFPVSARVQCVLRFFRPRFQDAPDFPASARGTHLQAIRLAAGSTMRMDLKVPLPLAPGLTAKLGLQAHHTELTPQHERFCDGTLTGALLRYNSLRTRDTNPLATWAEMVSLHGPDLDRLATALGRPGSVPSCEARYWLQRHPDAVDTPGKRGPIELLVALEGPHTDPQQRRYALHALFMAVAEATQAAKRGSHLIGPPVLPPSPLG
jgi:hypothetical protein